MLFSICQKLQNSLIACYVLLPQISNAVYDQSTLTALSLTYIYSLAYVFSCILIPGVHMHLDIMNLKFIFLAGLLANIIDTTISNGNATSFPVL